MNLCLLCMITDRPEVLIDQMPRSLIWALGFRERLDCPVDANPPTYNTLWTKNGVVINHLSDPRLNLQGNGSMIVENVMMSDTGNYRCTAISSFGSGDSQIVQVEVKGRCASSSQKESSDRQFLVSFTTSYGMLVCYKCQFLRCLHNFIYIFWFDE